MAKGQKIPVRFADDERTLMIPDNVLPQQKKWKDGEKYTVSFDLEQIGRDTMFTEHGDGSTRYRVIKSTGIDQDEALAQKIKDRT